MDFITTPKKLKAPRDVCERLEHATGMRFQEPSSIKRRRDGTEWLVMGTVRVEGTTLRYCHAFPTQSDAAVAVASLMSVTHMTQVSVRIVERVRWIYDAI